ncbi:MAG: hypothetical protein NT107_08975 [Planctomycetota bacterium]|nr:hypothetical protein [Planctomycetota bacterium]
MAAAIVTHTPQSPTLLPKVKLRRARLSITRMLLRLAPFSLLLAIACHTSQSGSDLSTASPMSWQPATPKVPLILDRKDLDPNVLSSLPRDTRTPLATMQTPAAGTPVLTLPNGTQLPALNGVAKPPSVKSDHTLPAVTALLVDDRGMEWYEHADGSMSSCRYAWSTEKKRWEAVALLLVPDQNK